MFKSDTRDRVSAAVLNFFFLVATCNLLPCQNYPPRFSFRVLVLLLWVAVEFRSLEGFRAIEVHCCKQATPPFLYVSCQLSIPRVSMSSCRLSRHRCLLQDWLKNCRQIRQIRQSWSDCGLKPRPPIPNPFKMSWPAENPCIGVDVNVFVCEYLCKWMFVYVNVLIKSSQVMHTCKHVPVYVCVCVSKYKKNREQTDSQTNKKACESLRRKKWFT